MMLWNALQLTMLTLISIPTHAAENNNPFQAALMITSLAPCIIVSGALAGTTAIPDLFKTAKSDALTFIGSDGIIRGAQFEQASRYYRSTHSEPMMSDMQLAQVIATSL